MKKVTLISGDGIGPEICNSLKEVFKSLNVPIEFEEINVTFDNPKKTEDLISNQLIDSIQNNKVAIKGPITTPIGNSFRSVNVYLRNKFDLYSNIRPLKSLPNTNSRYDNIDLIIFRENTEDLYIGEEHYENDDTAIAIKRITRDASYKIIKKAFEYAEKNNIDKVTVAHKANILKYTDGLFLEVARDIAKDYNNIKLEEIIIDNMCMQLVMYPEKYNIIVTTNLYGDILSDLGAGLVGGLGLAPGANIGDDIAIFEAVHGSAPDIAGQNLANPIALLLSGASLLNYLNFSKESKKLEDAIFKTLDEGKVLTKDLGGNSTTTDITKEIIRYL